MQFFPVLQCMWQIHYCLSFMFSFTYSGMVYEDAEVLYAEVKRDGEAILEDALSALLPASVPVLPSMRTKALGGSSKILAFNTTFLPRWDIVRIPSLSKAGPSLKSLVLQASEDGKEGYAIMHCPGGGAIGELKHPSSGLHELIKPVSGEWLFSLLQENLMLGAYSVYTNGSDHFVLRNASVQLTISNGRISSLVDVKSR